MHRVLLDCAILGRPNANYHCQISMSAKRLIFLCAYNPTDMTKWSGITYSIYNAIIEKISNNSLNTKVTYVGRGLILFDLLARLVNKTFQKFGSHVDCRYSTM